MKAEQLKTNEMTDPIGIGSSHVFFSWHAADGSQAAYQIQVFLNQKMIIDTGRVPSRQMHASFDLPGSSRAQVSWRIKLLRESEEEAEWSGPAFFEYGLLHPEDWEAHWITPELAPLKKDAGHQPAGYLKKIFALDDTKQARLYITAHGLYHACINGKEITDALLTPGAGEYEKRLPVQTYDVSRLISIGTNEMTVTLGDGWYRSTSGVDGDRNLFGDDIALLAQLEISQKTVLITDDTWQASTNGPLRMNDLQQGEVYDARMNETADWHNVRVLSFSGENLACADTIPVKGHEVFAGRLITTPNGEIVIDYGQNIAGQIAFMVQGHDGDVIEMIHGETLDENGNFTQENFQDRKRHKEGGMEQKIRYICAEGENQYRSYFTIMGFRYAKVTGNLNPDGAKFAAIAVYSDMKETASFHCSNADLNQLFQNAMWSMKSNFCDIPTDCPTRERAGWTGDAGVFAETGLRMMDSYPVFRKWLKECQLLQHDDGKVANIAPKNNRPTMFSGMLAGSVGWGDAVINVPYEMYQYTGDASILDDNYEMMKKWYGYLENRAAQKPLTKLFSKNPYEKYTIDTGIDYGEWCEPGVGTEAMRDPLKPVGTAYLYQSGRRLAEMAERLGKKDDAAHYLEVSENAKKAYRAVFTEDGRIHSLRQADYVRAIQFDLLSSSEKKQAASDLNQMIIANDSHLNTGFLSTPYLCKVLSDYGYADTAYQLLLQDTSPSWLYAVKKGATTIWETWNGIDENNHPSASLNHYSYGAICGWLLSGVCGIKYHDGSVTIQPVINARLADAEGKIDTPCGTIEAGWKIKNQTAAVHCSIPEGIEAKIILPDGTAKKLETGNWEFETEVL